PASDFLVVANTNTWNAYNAWGGQSNYTSNGDGVLLSFERPNPEARPSARTGDAYQNNHLVAAEVWLQTWLEDSGYRFDVCDDIAHDPFYGERCGFVVKDAKHRFFNGTNLAAGEVIGQQGRSGAACGWEVDTAKDFDEGNGLAPAGLEVLGHGELVGDTGYTG